MLNRVPPLNGGAQSPTISAPAYLPQQRALLLSDGVMCDPNGDLRVWGAPWHERRVLPALRAIRHQYDIEHVLVSHGEPVHRRQDLEAALERAPGDTYQRQATPSPEPWAAALACATIQECLLSQKSD